MAKVKDALRPTGRVQASAYSSSLAALTGSTKGSLSAREFGAISNIGGACQHDILKKNKTVIDWTLGNYNDNRSRS